MSCYPPEAASLEAGRVRLELRLASGVADDTDAYPVVNHFCCDAFSPCHEFFEAYLSLRPIGNHLRQLSVALVIWFSRTLRAVVLLCCVENTGA